jgi:ATP-binding cassette subfamily B protein
MQQKHCLWVQNLRDFLSYEPKIQSGEKIPDEFESLEFKNVSFRYTESSDYILKNISFRLEKGQTMAVVGQNGAGKTTLSKLIMRFYDVTEGEILYNGINIKEYDVLKYREKFAFVILKNF